MSRKSLARSLLTTVLLAAAPAACVDPPDVDSAPQALAATYKASIKNRVLNVTGTAASSRLALRLGATPTTLVLDVGDDGSADLSFDRSRFERISIDAGGGDDVVRIDETAGAFTTEEQVTINGGAGADTLTGGVGAETLLGGAGADTILGGFSADTIALGTGDDTVVWDPGGGNDVVEGNDGVDTLQLHLSNANESVALTAAAGHVRLTRDVASVVMDLHALELVAITARGGTDRIAVADLTEAQVARVDVDLSSAVTGQGDGVADTVELAGTPAADTFDVWPEGGGVAAAATATEVRVTGGDASLDRLVLDGQANDQVNLVGSPSSETMTAFPDPGGVVYDGFGYGVLVAPGAPAAVLGLGGDDRITASSGILTPLSFDGGDGNDHLVGSHGSDRLIGGAGDDTGEGRAGADAIALGDGDDAFIWQPGDGSDAVDGDAGHDAVVFQASNANDTLGLRAIGARVSLTRDIGATTTDLGGFERIDLTARGGTDRIVIGSLAGTPAAEINVDLAALPGGGPGDTQIDTVVLDGAAADAVGVSAQGDAVRATGLGTQVNVRGGEPSLDRLSVAAGALTIDGTDGADTMFAVPDATAVAYGADGYDVLVVPTATTPTSLCGLGGADTLTASNGVPTPVRIEGGDGDDTILGGSGADLLVGGAGADLVDGNQGADVVRLGDGDDTFQWDPGDGSDVADGDLGVDVVAFHGANIGEQLELRRAGDRVTLFRNIATITLDLGGFERIGVGARGGADAVRVGDLAGTSVTQVDVDLAAVEGTATGDALVDAVDVVGSAASDAITIAPDAGAVRVTGLPVEVRIVGEEPFDQLTVAGAGGLDTFAVAAGIELLISVATLPD